MDATDNTPGPGNLILLTDGQFPGAVIDPTDSVLHTLVIQGAGGRPLVSLNTETGEMEFGPDYSPDTAAEAFWAAIRCVGTAPVLFAQQDEGSITDFSPGARSDARKDPRYGAVLEQVRKMAWPAGNPMVPGGWADTLAKDVMAAVRKAEGQHRLITHHPYAGPGPCTAPYLGAGPCGYPADEHATPDDTGGNM